MTLPFANSRLPRMLHILRDPAFVISPSLYLAQSFSVHVFLVYFFFDFASQVADLLPLLGPH